MKLLYKPLGLLVSVLGGILASAVFNKVWTAATGQQEAPEATSAEHSTKQVLLAALVQGAVFGVVKAAVDRAGAKALRRSPAPIPGK